MNSRLTVMTWALGGLLVCGVPVPAEATSILGRAPATTPITGYINNLDDKAYDLELSCPSGTFTSRIKAREQVLLDRTAQSGCRLMVIQTEKTLNFEGARHEIKIEGGAPHYEHRVLRWRIQITTFRTGDAWPEGLQRQWTEAAVASSEYSSPMWGAQQITGPANTMGCGDFQTAWAPLKAQSTEPEWIELKFLKKMRAKGLRLYITNAPGAVREVLGRTQSGWESLWRGTDPTKTCPARLEITFSEEIDTDSIKVILDTSANQSWFEVDAAELVGRFLD